MGLKCFLSTLLNQVIKKKLQKKKTLFLKLSRSIDNTEMNTCMWDFIIMILMQYEHSVVYVSVTVQQQNFSVQGNAELPKRSLKVLVVRQSFSQCSHFLAKAIRTI